jgi:hypothetical protein
MSDAAASIIGRLSKESSIRCRCSFAATVTELAPLPKRGKSRSKRPVLQFVARRAGTSLLDARFWSRAVAAENRRQAPGSVSRETSMKILSLSAAAVLLVAGLSVANAQNQPTTNSSPPPNSINMGSTAHSGRSGAESQPVAKNGAVRIIGDARYCTRGRDHVLHCHFRSMASCEKHGHHGNLACVARPSATTGAAVMRR